MPSFMCVRQRAYWVREVMHIDAENENKAEELFYNTFDPELVVEELYRPSGDLISTPLEIFEQE